MGKITKPITGKPGDILKTAGKRLPDGYIPLQGQLLAREAYPKLHAAIQGRYDPAAYSMFPDFFRLPDAPADMATADNASAYATYGSAKSSGVNFLLSDHFEFAKIINIVADNSSPNQYLHFFRGGIALQPGRRYFLPFVVRSNPSGDGPDLFHLRLGVTELGGGGSLTFTYDTTENAGFHIDLALTSSTSTTGGGSAKLRDNNGGGAFWDETSLGNILDYEQGLGLGFLFFAVLVDTSAGTVSVMRDGIITEAGTITMTGNALYPYIGYVPEDSGTTVETMAGLLFSASCNTPIPGIGVNPGLPIPAGWENPFDVGSGEYLTGDGSPQKYLYGIKAK